MLYSALKTFFRWGGHGVTSKLKQSDNEQGLGGGMPFYSLNIRGMRDENNRNNIFNIFRNKTPGVLLYQETYSYPSDLEVWRRQWGPNTYMRHMTHGTCNSRGVSVIIP